MRDDDEPDERERLQVRVDRLERLLATLENRLGMAQRERTRAALTPLLDDVQAQYARAIDALWRN